LVPELPAHRRGDKIPKEEDFFARIFGGAFFRSAPSGVQFWRLIFLVSSFFVFFDQN
jgi:hypothetical protein